MLKTRGILDNLGIESWLDCGTLLMMYRDKHPDYTDCDMAIYKKDATKLLSGLKYFLNDGYTLYDTYTHPKLGLVELSMFYGQHKVDIFIKFYSEDMAYMVSTRPNGTYIVGKYPKRHFRPLTLYTLDENVSIGQPYHWKIPNDVESYLESYYGKDWRTPRPVWNWMTDAPCIDTEFKI